MIHFGFNKALPVIWSAVAVLSLSSCLGPHKVNKWVAQHYSEEPSEGPRKKDASITISSALPDLGAKLSETKKNTQDLLPLLFYWQYDYRNTCTLNPAIGVNIFSSAVYGPTGHGLKQKLKGNRLELTIEKMPGVFVVDDKGHIVWLIITMVGWEKLSVQPKEMDMVVSYRVLGPDNIELKKRSITIADHEQTLALGMFKSLRNLTKQHLSEYDANVAAMARKVVDRLVAEL